LTHARLGAEDNGFADLEEGGRLGRKRRGRKETYLDSLEDGSDEAVGVEMALVGDIDEGDYGK
jgi:hypothetical protein